MAGPVLLPYFLVGASALIGAVLVLGGLLPILRERASRRWPRAPGVVVSSRYTAKDYQYRDEQGYDRDATSFTPVVEYQYTVGVQRFEGSRISLHGVGTTSADRVKMFIDRYPPGARLEVFYDPRAPASAFLETGASSGAVFLVGFGSIFVALALLGIVLMVCAH